MWCVLWQRALALISAERCPCCRAEATPALGFCPACDQRLGLLPGGLQDAHPLRWHALAPYTAALRQLLLQQRPHPDAAVVEALSRRLAGCCRTELDGVLLVPIPSWKIRANPLPELLAASLCQGGGARRAALLERSRPVLGQHGLQDRKSTRLNSSHRT